MIQRQMILRQCRNNSKHKGNPIQGFCLEPNCSQERLVCCICIFDSHIEHPMIFFRQARKDEEQARQKRSKILNLYIKWYVGNAFEEIPQISKKEMFGSNKELENQEINVRGKIQNVIEAFFNVSIHHIKKVLTSNVPLKHLQIQTYAKILPLIHRPPQNIMELLRNLCNENLMNLYQPMNDALRKIRQALSNFQKSMKIFKSPKYLPQQKSIGSSENSQGGAQNLQQEKIGKILQKRFKQNMKAIKISYSRKKPKMKNEVIQIQDQSIVEEQVLMPCQKKQTKIDSPREVNNQLIDQQVENENKIIAIEAEDDSQKSQSYYMPPHRNYKQSRIIKNSMQNISIDVQNVREAFVTCYSSQEINKILYSFDPSMIRHLIIKCDIISSVLNQTSVELISQMKQLVSLKIYLACGLSEPMAVTMLQKLSQLQELVLAEFADLGPLLVKSLKECNKRLKRVCFTYDMEYIINNEEILQFIPDFIQGIRQEKLWQELTKSQLQLTNLEIQNASNINYWIDYIKSNKDRLKEVTIYNSNDQAKTNITGIFSALKQCKNLQYLRLQQLTFNPTSLQKIFLNNPGLKAIHLSECPTVQQTYDIISSLPKLEYFYIGLDDQFHGKVTFVSNTIKTIIIRGCLNEQGQNLAKNISVSKELRNLSLNYTGQCLNEESATEIANCPSIRYLNLNYNHNASKYLQKFAKMSNIQCFISLECGLSYQRIAQCSFASNLKKLSISGVDTQNDKKEDLDIQILVRSFPNLTHLKMIKFGKIVGNLHLFSKMRFLVSVIGGKFTGKQDGKRLRVFFQSKQIKYRNVAY